MVSMDSVMAQFKSLGFKPSFWNRPEVHELPHILMLDEKLTHIVTGWYNGGFALLCCTDQRVLLVDKKVFFLTLEDLRYEMVAEIMYQNRLLDATLLLYGFAKTLEFKSWNQAKLRQMASYIQTRVLSARQQSDQLPAWQAFVTHPHEQPSTPHNQGQHQGQQISDYSSLFKAHPTYVKNPYSGKPHFRKRVSRFVTSSQLSR